MTAPWDGPPADVPPKPPRVVRSGLRRWTVVADMPRGVRYATVKVVTCRSPVAARAARYAVERTLRLLGERARADRYPCHFAAFGAWPCMLDEGHEGKHRCEPPLPLAGRHRPPLGTIVDFRRQGL